MNSLDYIAKRFLWAWAIIPFASYAQASYFVLASLSSVENAESFSEDINVADYQVVVQAVNVRGSDYYRVLVGPVSEDNENRLRHQLVQLGYAGLWLAEGPEQPAENEGSEQLVENEGFEQPVENKVADTNSMPGATPTCQGTTQEKLVCQSDQVKALLKQWVLALSEGDIDTYLDLYTSLRSPKDGMSRDEWEKLSRARVSHDNLVEIDLKLESLGMEDSGILDVVFLKLTHSDGTPDTTRKRLFLVHEAGDLKIWKEELLL